MAYNFLCSQIQVFYGLFISISYIWGETWQNLEYITIPSSPYGAPNRWDKTRIILTAASLLCIRWFGGEDGIPRRLTVGNRCIGSWDWLEIPPTRPPCSAYFSSFSLRNQVFLGLFISISYICGETWQNLEYITIENGFYLYLSIYLSIYRLVEAPSDKCQ